MGSLQAVLVRFMLRCSAMWNQPLEGIRSSLSKVRAAALPPGLDIGSEILGGVACERFSRQGAAARGAIVHFHGGGFCLGVYPATRSFAAGLAAATGLAVILPDYRLAPENPFPAAWEDARSVLQAVVRDVCPMDQLVVSGDSSGCALALSAVLELRRQGRGVPRRLVFLCPVLDLAGEGESLHSRAAVDPFRPADPLGLTRLYSAGHDPRSERLSPLFGDLAGLPPALVHAADADVFLSDATRFADRLRQAGGTVELKVKQRMWHVFHLQAGFVPEAGRAMREVHAFIGGTG